MGYISISVICNFKKYLKILNIFPVDTNVLQHFINHMLLFYNPCNRGWLLLSESET